MHGKRNKCQSLTLFCPNSRPDPILDKGQAMVEAVIVMASLFIVLFIGLSFVIRCNMVKINQQIKLRQEMLSKSPETSGRNFLFSNIASFMGNVAYGDKVSTEGESVKIPHILKQSFDDKDTINIKSHIYVLRGSWSTRDFVNKIKKTMFPSSSINGLMSDVSVAEKYIEEEQRRIIK